MGLHFVFVIIGVMAVILLLGIAAVLGTSRRPRR
jgi:hypothetical protein